MKELSIEEKAKCYDEALERAREFYPKIADTVLGRNMAYILPALQESEDEKIRNRIIERLKCMEVGSLTEIGEEVAWLEKQEEHANFRNKIQIGDKVTRNEDGMLVNLSQLARIAKKDERQCEQNPAWSEEDIMRIDNLIAIIEHRGYPDYVDYLEKLKDRYVWKPSEKQMNTLEQWLQDNRYNGDARYCYTIFDSLYQDLKKLMEE